MHGGVFLAQVLKSPSLILGVVDDVRYNAALKERGAALEHQVTTLQAMFFAVACELLEQVLALEPFFHLIYAVEATELFAVLVGEEEGELDGKSRPLGFLEVAGVERGVLGDEDVGHDATSAVDGAPEQCLVFRPVVMNTVGREELSALVAGHEVVFVLFAMPLFIGFLDAAARGGVVAGNGQAHHAAVLELNGLLHQSLAEGTTPDDGAPVIVLNGSGEDFGGRS